MKKFPAIYIGTLLGLLVFGNGSIQAQKYLSITNLEPGAPIIMNDTVPFEATINLDSLSFPSAAYGDLYYYYQTDSMIAAGVAPRIIGLDGIDEWVYDGMTHNVPIDIRPDEIRTTPPNLIILWPAMITNDTIIQTDSIVIDILLDDVEQILYEVSNLVYPNPIEQLLYISPVELPLLSKIKTISQSDGTSRTYYRYEFLNVGSIDLSDHSPGWYTVEIRYLLGLLTKYVTMYKQ